MWVEEHPLAPPPRPVAPGAVIEVLVGSLFLQVFWGALVILSGIGWVFAVSADVTFWRFWGERGTVEGRVTKRLETGWRWGGTRDSTRSHRSRGQPVVGARFEFVGPDGVQRSGISYTDGSGHSVGDRVPVEFPLADPGTSRVVGERCGQVSALFNVFLTFPALGVLGIWWLLKGGIRDAWLLRKGARAEARLATTEPAGEDSEGGRMWRVSFAFAGADGREHTFHERMHSCPPEGETKQILYDPARPRRVADIGSFLGRGRTTPEGGWGTAEGARPGLWLIVPGLAVGINLLFGLVKLASF